MRVEWMDIGGKPVTKHLAFGQVVRGLQVGGHRPDTILIGADELGHYLRNPEMTLSRVRDYMMHLNAGLAR